MSVIGTVVELWRYPVSSLGGERLPQLAVQEAGVEGDRQFGVVDTRSGEIASPHGDARWRPVALIKSRLRGGSPEISMDGETWFGVPGEAADRAVSAFLGFPCAVRPYHKGDPLSPPAAVRLYEPSPIHLVTTASLARLNELHPQGQGDARRFRPNILVDTQGPAGAFLETGWVGRRLRVGKLGLVVTEPCRRCGFTIQAQDGLDYDPEILRQIVRANNRTFGIYCAVITAGEVRLGDEIRLD